MASTLTIREIGTWIQHGWSGWMLLRDYFR